MSNSKEKIPPSRKKQLRRDRNRLFIGNYIRGKHCDDCGEEDWRLFEFDHLPEHKKYKDISTLIRGAYSIKTIEAELLKCDIVCANCHRIRTLKRQKNWRTEYWETEW